MRRKAVEGEAGRRYGSRNYLVYPGQVLVARDGDWHLVGVPAWSRAGEGGDGRGEAGRWLNYKLYLDRPGRKNLWHVGVRIPEGRVGRSRERKLLEEHHPERLAWVVEQALRHGRGEVTEREEEGVRIVYRGGRWARDEVEG